MAMIGSRFGPWVLDKEIGRGGMGRVYLAHAEPPPDQGPHQAAVKVLVAELGGQDFQSRFQREIDILRQLDHPGIVHFYGSGAQDGRPWFAMEYVAGPNLEDVRQERDKLPWQQVLDLALQIAPALKHAHDRGIIHRDLKPSNLLLTEIPPPDGASLGQVKLTDFGIASLFNAAHLTATGLVVGTAEYLSPEQAAGKPVSQRSDLYSLGVVLYTLLTGRPPFDGEAADLLHKHVYGQFDRPIRFVPDLPPELDNLLCQMMEKDPARRPGDGLVLLRRLDCLRLKIEHKARQATGDTAVAPTKIVLAGGQAAGPATLMSRLMREELERQNRGGPVKHLSRNPWIIIPLFLLTVGILVWTFWPLSNEARFQRGFRLMASANPDDWETGWSNYLEKLAADPHNPHAEELDRYRQQYEAYRTGREAAVQARFVKPTSEAQWFYRQALRFRQTGNEEAARAMWNALEHAFHDVPSEAAWVKLAEDRLADDPVNVQKVPRDLKPIRAALEKARELRQEGKQAKADAIRQALQELYGKDPAVQRLLAEE
jgi:tRNA A-37 threonylcarbamoyl transferase component Bud32